MSTKLTVIVDNIPQGGMRGERSPYNGVLEKEKLTEPSCQIIVITF